MIVRFQDHLIITNNNSVCVYMYVTLVDFFEKLIRLKHYGLLNRCALQFELNKVLCINCEFYTVFFLYKTNKKKITHKRLQLYGPARSKW